MSGPAPAAFPPDWDWPSRLPVFHAQRLLDTHVIRTVEAADRPFQLYHQGQALNALISHARQASPWWREWLAPPPGVPGVPLKEMPILDRAAFRASVEAAGALPLPASHGGVEENATSGSSGVPAKFFLSALTGRIVDAQYFVDHQRQGRDLSRKSAALMIRFEPHPGLPHRVLPADPSQGVGEIAARCSLGRTFHEHAAWLRAVNPSWFSTAPTLFSGILDIYAAGEKPPGQLRQVLTSGETVTPEFRQRARELTGARISDRYSSEEAGAIAFQCPHDTSDDPPYHACVSSTIVEVVDEAGRACAPGVAGRVLVTALHHWASPVIRYDIGDVAALHPHCSCGAQVPTLTNLLGRKRFLIRLPSGERKFVRFVAKDWLPIAPVREYRVTQHAEAAVRVEVVLERPLAPAEREGLLEMLAGKFDPSFHIGIEQVDRIDWAPGGKRQEIVSLV